MDRWFVQVAGETEGPISGDALTLRIAARKLDASAMVRPEADEGWKLLAEVPRFARLLPTRFAASPVRSPVASPTFATAPVVAFTTSPPLAIPPGPAMPAVRLTTSSPLEAPSPSEGPSPDSLARAFEPAPAVVGSDGPPAGFPVSTAREEHDGPPYAPHPERQTPVFPAAVKPRPAAAPVAARDPHPVRRAASTRRRGGGTWLLPWFFAFAAASVATGFWLRHRGDAPEAPANGTPLAPTNPPSDPIPAGAAGRLAIADVVVGSGHAAQAGDRVRVKYTGKLSDGTVFDSNANGGKTFDFVLGKGSVIKGWEQGLPGMKVGGTRKLTIPPNLGYGSRASGKIPANATLVFDVELVAIER